MRARGYIRPAAHVKTGAGRRRGFTLVEVMVSMALVVLITIAALATVQFAFYGTRKNNIKQRAVRETDNIIACYQSDDFEAGIRLLYGDAVGTLTPGTPVTVYFTAEGETVTATHADVSWYIQATVDDTANTIELVAAYTDDGDVIYTSTYIGV